MKPAINLYLATATGCNVRCWSCPAGRKEPEPGGIMSMEMLLRILDKCTKESKVLSVQLYHYNEPTLLSHMADMVMACHNYGLPVFLSSNLVIDKNLLSIMAAGPDTFLVSASGWTQEVYQRSHKDGDIEKVKRNMELIARHRTGNTVLQLSWHRYRYNEHEMPLMKRFAEGLGFQFAPYATSIIPHDRAMKSWATGIPVPHADEFIVPVDSAKDLCSARKNWVCILQEQILAVNGKGDYMLCSNFADNSNILGNLFDKTVSQILKDRKSNPVCIACKSVGGHVYAMQSYTRSKWSPLVIGEQIYRRLGLQGTIPKLSQWATQHLYMRPQEKPTV